jgi:hypothetical protein
VIFIVEYLSRKEYHRKIYSAIEYIREGCMAFPFLPTVGGHII